MQYFNRKNFFFVDINTSLSLSWYINIRGPFHKAGLVKTLGLLTLKWGKLWVFRFTKGDNSTRERGITLACFTERGNLRSRLVTVVTDSMNLTWSGPGFSQGALTLVPRPRARAHLHTKSGTVWLVWARHPYSSTEQALGHGTLGRGVPWPKYRC